MVQKAEEFCAESGANNAEIEAKNDLEIIDSLGATL